MHDTSFLIHESLAPTPLPPPLPRTPDHRLWASGRPSPAPTSVHSVAHSPATCCPWPSSPGLGLPLARTLLCPCRGSQAQPTHMPSLSLTPGPRVAPCPCPLCPHCGSPPMRHPWPHPQASGRPSPVPS